MADDEDLIILKKIYDLEKKPLSPNDKKIVKLVRTQLENDWRKTLIDFLDRLLRRYK